MNSLFSSYGSSFRLFFEESYVYYPPLDPVDLLIDLFFIVYFGLNTELVKILLSLTTLSLFLVVRYGFVYVVSF